jgi:hypothetical protein
MNLEKLSQEVKGRPDQALPVLEEAAPSDRWVRVPLFHVCLPGDEARKLR